MRSDGCSAVRVAGTANAIPKSSFGESHPPHRPRRGHHDDPHARLGLLAVPEEGAPEVSPEERGAMHDEDGNPIPVSSFVGRAEELSALVHQLGSALEAAGRDADSYFREPNLYMTDVRAIQAALAAYRDWSETNTSSGTMDTK